MKKILPRGPVPALLVTDIQRTLAFYRALGFTVSGFSPDEKAPSWVEVHRNDMVLQFHTEPSRGMPQTPVCSGTFYFLVDDVMGLAEEWGDTVTFAWGPELMDYGLHEFGVKDPDGYFLAFAEPARVLSFDHGTSSAGPGAGPPAGKHLTVHSAGGLIGLAQPTHQHDVNFRGVG